jgi:hypothetical protein
MATDPGTWHMPLAVLAWTGQHATADAATYDPGRYHGYAASWAQSNCPRACMLRFGKHRQHGNATELWRLRVTGRPSGRKRANARVSHNRRPKHPDCQNGQQWLGAPGTQAHAPPQQPQLGPAVHNRQRKAHASSQTTATPPPCALQLQQSDANDQALQGNRSGAGTRQHH